MFVIQLFFKIVLLKIPVWLFQPCNKSTGLPGRLFQPCNNSAGL